MSLKKAYPMNLKNSLKKSQRVQSQHVQQENQSSDKTTEASLKALDMLDRGLLTERAALAVIGTHQDAYSVAPDIRLKALELVEQDKLSERGLTAILGV
jgi:hypothetical protein